MKPAIAIVTLAAFLYVQIPAQAGMTSAPKSEGGAEELQGEALLAHALPEPLGDQLTAGRSFLESYQLLGLVITIVTAGLLLVAILGYGIFDKKKDKREDDLRDLP